MWYLWITISIQHLFLFIIWVWSGMRELRKFQYNTCFYLSTKLLVEGKEEEEFQYNTCFYLSFSNVWVSFSIQKFQYNTCFYLSTWWRWNLHLKMISIQHLFLFIENVKTKIQNLSKFQYNTCFYLSGQRPSFHCV